MIRAALIRCSNGGYRKSTIGVLTLTCLTVLLLIFNFDRSGMDILIQCLIRKRRLLSLRIIPRCRYHLSGSRCKFTVIVKDEDVMLRGNLKRSEFSKGDDPSLL